MRTEVDLQARLDQRLDSFSRLIDHGYENVLATGDQALIKKHLLDVAIACGELEALHWAIGDSALLAWQKTLMRMTAGILKLLAEGRNDVA